MDNCNAEKLTAEIRKVASDSGADLVGIVTADMIVPKNSLVIGIPGKIVKQDKKLRDLILFNAGEYQRLSKEHREGKYTRYR